MVYYFITIGIIKTLVMQSKPWTLGSNRSGCKFKNTIDDLLRTQEHKNRKDGEDEQNNVMICGESINQGGFATKE